MSLILDHNINPWLNNMDLIENRDYLNKILSIGYKVHNMAHISLNPESNIFQPITHEINEIKSDCQNICQNVTNEVKIFNEKTQKLENQMSMIRSQVTESVKNECSTLKEYNTTIMNGINKLTGASKTSITKGDMAERYINNVLEHQFPDDTSVIKSQTAHEADIHLHSPKNPTILIESKFYTKVVNSAQVEKFYNDLDTTGLNFGIFIAFQTGIIGHYRLEYCRRNNKHIIFIPNAEFGNYAQITYAVLFLKQLNTICQNNSTINLSEKVIEEKCKMIYDSIGDLDKMLQFIQRTKSEMIKARNEIEKQVCQVMNSLWDTEVQTKRIVDKIKLNISNSLVDLVNDYQVIRPAELNQLIQKMSSSNSKILHLVSQTLPILSDNKIEIKEVVYGSKYLLNKMGESFGEIKITKKSATYDIKPNKGIKNSISISSNKDINHFLKIIKAFS